MRKIEHAMFSPAHALPAGGKRLLFARLLVAQHAGQEAGDYFHHHRGGQLPAAQDILANRNLITRQVFCNAFVYALIPARDQDNSGLTGQFLGNRLSQKSPLRRKQNDREIRPGGLRLQGLNSAEDGLGFEDHAGPAAKGPIIHAPVAVIREVPQVAEPDFNMAGHHGALQQAVLKDTSEKVRKNRDDVENHRSKLFFDWQLLSGLPRVIALRLVPPRLYRPPSNFPEPWHRPRRHALHPMKRLRATGSARANFRGDQ